MNIMPSATDRRFLTWTLAICVAVLAVAAVLFGTQIITTNDRGPTVQSPQAPAQRPNGENPSAR